jgi:hypothetical protein
MGIAIVEVVLLVLVAVEAGVKLGVPMVVHCLCVLRNGGSDDRFEHHDVAETGILRRDVQELTPTKDADLAWAFWAVFSRGALKMRQSIKPKRQCIIQKTKPQKENGQTSGVHHYQQQRRRR